jgi:hypothetical protein
MKAIWINPLTTGSTSLDTSVNPHDVDQRALSLLLERQGYEVWLQEPYLIKRSQSNWERKVRAEELSTFDADVAILSCGPFTIDYLGHRYGQEVGTSRADKLDLTTKWLDEFKGQLFIFITDPRPSFQEVFLKPRGNHALIDHINRAKLLVADVNFLDPSLRHRGVTSNYWKAVEVCDPLAFNEDSDYFCVYPGMKSQNKDRKKLVANWMDAEDCYTAGQIKVGKIPSVSDFNKVTLAKVLDLTNNSTTSLICGEPTHTWLTPRVIQSLVCGTICSVHPQFAGAHQLPSDMVLEQTVARASEFDIELSERVYRRQVDFAMSLYNSDAKSGIV